MSNDPRLERYLTVLEQALKPFPISDRAEIITEIKSHVLSALDRDPQTRLDSVLSALGEPETVANRYLMERGLKPAKTSIQPIVKWLIIGFLCTSAMVLIFIGFLISRSSSLVKIDGKKGKIEILGGLIDIDGKKNSLSFAGFDDNDSLFSGVEVLEKNKSVSVKFTSGKMDVETATGNEFSWSCSGAGEFDKLIKFQNQSSTIDFTSLQSPKCRLRIPAGARLVILGAVGKINFDRPHFDISADLNVGKISFQSAENTAYNFNVSVDKGKADQFESSKEKEAQTVKLHVSTGKIEKEN